MDTITFVSLHSHIFTYAMIKAYYVISHLDITEMGNSFLLAYPGQLSFLTSENILFCQHRQLHTRQLKAIQQTSF